MAPSPEEGRRLGHKLNLSHVVAPAAQAAFVTAMKITDIQIDNVARGLSLRPYEFSPDVFGLVHWMDLHDERLGSHVRTAQYFTERTLGYQELSGWRQYDAPEIVALKHAASIHDLGKLSFTEPMLKDNSYQFTKEDERVRRLHPAVGAFLFWKSVQEIPEFVNADKEMRKEWYLTKDLITGIILYHHPDYGHRTDKVGNKSLVEMNINVPKLTNERFRKAAIIFSLIDSAVGILEGRDSQDGGIPISEQISLKLKSRIGQYKKRLIREHGQIPPTEIHFYHRLAEKIAVDFPNHWSILKI